MRTPTPLSVPMLRMSAMALMAGLLTATAPAFAQQPAAPAPAAAPQAAAGCPAILQHTFPRLQDCLLYTSPSPRD